MNASKIAAAAGLAGALFLASGCSQAADKVQEKAAEKTAEKALEEAGGGKVDIDTDSGKVKIETDEGTISSDENGVTVEGQDGDSTYSVGEGAELPKDWPSDLDPPSGAKIISSSTSEQDGKAVMAVMAEVDGSVQDVYDGLKDQLTSAGFEITTDNYGTAGGGAYGALSGTSDEWEATASITSGSGSDTTTVTMSLTEVAA